MVMLSHYPIIIFVAMRTINKECATLLSVMTFLVSTFGVGTQLINIPNLFDRLQAYCGSKFSLNMNKTNCENNNVQYKYSNYN